MFDFSDQLLRYGHHSTIVRPSLTRTVTLGSMRLINVDAFLQIKWLLRSGRQVNRRTRVLAFRDDEATKYAILSHRWIDEVDYEEMVDLHRMDRQEQDEIRSRLGYKKILNTCKLAKLDGYEWVWVDTCCVDKRSSGELSEVITSIHISLVWKLKDMLCVSSRRP